MADISEEERQKMIPEISRKLAAVLEKNLSGELGRDPLDAALPLKHRKAREMGWTVIS